MSSLSNDVGHINRWVNNHKYDEYWVLSTDFYNSCDVGGNCSGFAAGINWNLSDPRPDGIARGGQTNRSCCPKAFCGSSSVGIGNCSAPKHS